MESTGFYGQKERRVRRCLFQRMLTGKAGEYMQIGGFDDHSSAHHITSCIHDHGSRKKEEAGMLKGPGAEQNQVSQSQTERVDYRNITGWFRHLMDGGKNWLGKIWGNGGTPADTQTQSSQSGEVRHTLQQAQEQAVQTVQLQGLSYAANPYFIPADKQGGAAEMPADIKTRLKIKLEPVTKFMERHFHKNFQKKKGFLSGDRKQEQKEDLRRHSRYREDELELECMITDDSYLLDSYDKKGEFTTIGEAGQKNGRVLETKH